MSGNEAKTRGLHQLQIAQLRNMAIRFLTLSETECNSKTKSELISILSSQSSENASLKREINKLSVAIRPSFYLVNIIPNKKTDFELNKRSVVKIITNNVSDWNKATNARGGYPSPRSLQYDGLINKDGVIEIQFTWQRIHWYWNQNVEYNHIYELRYGYSILDFNSLRGMLICQSKSEKRMIEKALDGIAEIKLTTQQLTQNILGQIGDYDLVKSAKYQRQDKNSDKPFEMRFSDEELSTKSQAREEEIDPFSERVQSFYRIPIAGVEEYGIGATSKTGKLWLPRMTPLDTVRDFGGELLARVSESVNSMVKAKEYDQVLSTLGLNDLEEINSITPIRLREVVLKLVHTLANMILNNETRRPFSITDTLAIEAAGNLFLNPIIYLEDIEEDITSIWRDGDGKQLVKISRNSADELVVKIVPGNSELDLTKMRHTITGNEIDISNSLYESIRLFPTPNLIDAILQGFHVAGSRLEKLLEINNLPFVIYNNQIILDISRTKRDSPPVEVNPTDVREYQSINSRRVNPDRREEFRKRLESLGEKCKNESSQNCEHCLSDGQYFCLRTLAAKKSHNAQLVRHQGIELSDGEGILNIEGQRMRFFMFAKQNKGGKQLTLKNTEGAKLIAQVLDQVEKNTFEIIMIVSPTPLADNLLNAIRMLCKHFGKRLLLLDQDMLSKMLIDFEEESEFDKINLNDLYKRSRTKKI